MTAHASNQGRVIPLRPLPAKDARLAPETSAVGARRPPESTTATREPLWRDLVGDVLRRERRAQRRTLKDVADKARISMPYLSEVERGRKEASSEVLAAAARALGLGLGDLLTMAQDELARVTDAGIARNRSGATSFTSSGHGRGVGANDVQLAVRSLGERRALHTAATRAVPPRRTDVRLSA